MPRVTVQTASVAKAGLHTLGRDQAWLLTEDIEDTNLW